MNTELIKKKLIQRKKDIEDNLSSLKESAKPVDLKNPIGRLSRMDAMNQQQMSLHAKRQAEISLQQIQGALKRLEDGNYGECLKCEDEISKKRLDAYPEAPFCMRCQER